MRQLSRVLSVAGLWLACLLSSPVHALEPDDLLPVDQAFVLSASAPGRDRIELHWKITDGYYLYRHRTSVQVAAGGFTADKLQMPAGDRHVDEFFGEVETYRQQLTAVLPGKAAKVAGVVTLKVRYQGCADAGICYPPQTRNVQVTLPSAAVTAAAARDESAAATQSSSTATFNPLAAIGAASKPALAAGMDALPLPAEQAFQFDAIAFDGNQLLLRFTPAAGYYLYRDRTRMSLAGANGIALQSPRWPRGTSHHDEHFGDVVVYFDQVEVPVPLRREHADAADATLQVTFQGCQTNGICYPPMTRSVALSIPAGTATAAKQATATTDPGPGEADTVPDSSPATAATIPATGTTSDAAPVIGNDPGNAGVSMPEIPRTLPPANAGKTGNRGAGSLWLALLLALAGGLILNLMPCVLPVLSLKALSLANGDNARRGALWYTAGVLVTFVAVGALVIALRAAGQALGWGFQLQQPLVIAALVYIIFAVGLSLSGVFAVGYGLAGAGQRLSHQSGPAGDFFTGVLAVVVASPCTAPFMGAALAFAFATSPAVALLVFATLGLGLALPFLLIGFVPALANRLPRPGAWMETLKQVLAFPMYLTVVWLLWVLGKQRGIDAVGLALIGMVLLALGLWWWQRLALRRSGLQRTLAVLVMLSALLPLAMIRTLPAPATTTVADHDNHVPYSASALAELRADQRVVFVDMTADWCVTCKANEKAVLSQQAFKDAMQQADAVKMVGDWTNVDPAITEFLEAHGAVGVPLYVVYPADGGEGEVLPTVLTDAIVSDALQRARR
ncbi:protein-disulfide reductase DsbD family protein [Pseudoxanthomonas dokdonensis]|uniref:Cytochrome C biogenesis protein n=1 Tax=Pseudoxanthomonas dokdonensis TaxID=344882 RepID=A0A0R0CNJ5_9GAMM|nr:protein-disulfide reductase DsbD [Pseudoxanthomonas dokdonensis]KRG71581.1 cytochrome C biogenesis protein [Pseudoxanthomonas dokdonensis]